MTVDQDKVIEHAFLGAVLAARDANDAAIAVDAVKPEWFACEPSRVILDAVRNCRSNDIATIVNAVKDHPTFRHATAAQFLASFDIDLGRIRNVGEYITQLRDAHHERLRRRLLTAAINHAGDQTRLRALLAEIENTMVDDRKQIVHITDGFRERLAEREEASREELARTSPQKSSPPSPFASRCQPSTNCDQFGIVLFRGFWTCARWDIQAYPPSTTAIPTAVSVQRVGLRIGWRIMRPL